MHWLASASRSIVGIFALLVCAGLVVAACASVARTLTWRVEFATSALRGRTDAVVARVLEGGCDGAVIYEARIRSGDEMQVAPPLLGPGRYGLAAYAIDASCAEVASDCREAVVPSEGEFTLVLSDEADAPACPSDVCGAAACRFDGGARDAGPLPRDAGDADASRLDAGSDAGPIDAAREDTGPIDSGPPDTGPRDAGTDAAVCTTTSPRAVGSYTASPWFSRVDASGTTIRFATSTGTMGMITLSGGVTATGSIVASEICTGTCTPLSFRGVTASGHTLTFRDWMDVESTITLTGATATGSLELTSSDGYLVSVNAVGTTITFANGSMPAMRGTITLVPETTCR